jgi:hypothetical protein
MAVPSDAQKVLLAIKLGWAIAEVRGRNRPDPPPGARAGLPGPPTRALPLHVEQTPAELRIEAQSVLGAMARELGLGRGRDGTDFPAAIDAQAKRLYQARKAAAGAGAGQAADDAAAPAPAEPAPAEPAPHGPAAPAAAQAGGAEVQPGGAADAGDAAVPGRGADTGQMAPGDPDAEWAALQELIFRFDEHIQDAMASGPDTVGCGYQLGRALAEPYWALAPGLPDNAASPAAWWFLLGPERSGEMSRLAGRLTGYFHPLTAAAIAGSVQIWKHVAADPAWRNHAEDHLYLQIRRWYELLIMRQDPTTLVQPYALIRNFRMVTRALRIFWPELIGTTVAAAALSGFAVALGQHNISSFLKSALGFVAITGFSYAGLGAKLKSQAQAMVTRLRQDVYTDLVAVAITTAPPMPANRSARQNTKMARMARERGITPVTPA